VSEITLRYGLNPRNATAKIVFPDGETPFTLLNGDLGYVNVLDAATAWEIVSEAAAALRTHVAASIKHTNPVGLAAADLTGPDTTLAATYRRARDCDPVASFGDFIGLSSHVDADTATYISRVVSHGIIAPGFDSDALDILKGKRGGKYLILQANPDFVRPETEVRDVFGIRLEQSRDQTRITSELLDRSPLAQELGDTVRRDLLLAAIACRYCESNAIALVLDGQLIGIGGGQPSRIAATEIACTRGDLWKLRKALADEKLPLREGTKSHDIDQVLFAFAQQSLRAPGSQLTHPALSAPVPVLTGQQVQEALASFGSSSIWSDGFIPFEDNIEVAAEHGVGFLGQPGGSVRDPQVAAVAEKHGILVLTVGERFFYH
jgi:phosphoribosylaminoimidazolecarboxamide formyltransferase/IMP cyclohydrolase